VAGRAVTLQIVGLQGHDPIFTVCKGLDAGVRRIHKLAQLDSEFLHCLLAT
jgi:hypothetical protein